MYNSYTWTQDLVLHLSRNVVVPSLEAPGLRTGSGCLGAERTSGKTVHSIAQQLSQPLFLWTECLGLDETTPERQKAVMGP